MVSSSKARVAALKVDGVVVGGPKDTVVDVAVVMKVTGYQNESSCYDRKRDGSMPVNADGKFTYLGAVWFKKNWTPKAGGRASADGRVGCLSRLNNEEFAAVAKILPPECRLRKASADDRARSAAKTEAASAKVKRLEAKYAAS